MTSIRKEIEKTSEQISQVEAKRTNIVSQITQLEKVFKRVEIEVRSQNIVEIDRLKKELNSVLESRRLVLDELRVLGGELSKMEIRREMVLADFHSRAREQIEIVLQKEDLEQTLNRLGMEGDTCVQLLSQQQELEATINNNRSTFEQLKERETGLQTDIESINQALKVGETEYRSIKSRINAGLKLRDEKMKRIKRELELVLESFSNAFTLDGLKDNCPDRRLREIVSDIGKGIEMNILVEQIDSVTNQEISLTNTVNLRITELRDAILAESAKFQEHDTFFSTQFDVDSRIENFSHKYEKKLKVLADWKDNLSKILENNAMSTDYKETYSLFLEGSLEKVVKRELARRIVWTEAHQSRLVTLINLLYSYGESAGEKGKEFLHEKRQMEEVEVRNIELGCQRELAGFLLTKVQGQANLIQKTCASLESRLADTQAVFEAQIRQTVAAKLEERDQRLSQEYKKVQRTYGSVAVEKMKTEEKAEIVRTVVDEKKKELQQILDFQKGLECFEERIQKLRKMSHADLNPLINSFDARIKDICVSRQELMNRDKSLLQSEEELIYAINAIEQRDSLNISKRMADLRKEVKEFNSLCGEKDKLDLELEGLHSSLKCYKRECSLYERATRDLDKKEAELNEQLMQLESVRKNNFEKHDSIQKDIKERLRSLSRGEKSAIANCKHIAKSSKSGQVVIANFALKKKEKATLHEEFAQYDYPIVAQFDVKDLEGSHESNYREDTTSNKMFGYSNTSTHHPETQKNYHRAVRSILKSKQIDLESSNYRSNETVPIQYGNHKRNRSTLATIWQKEDSSKQELTTDPFEGNLNDSEINPHAILISEDQGLSGFNSNEKPDMVKILSAFHARNGFKVPKNSKGQPPKTKSKSHDFTSTAGLEDALKRLKLNQSKREGKEGSSLAQVSRMEDSLIYETQRGTGSMVKRGLTNLQQSHEINKMKAEMIKESKIEAILKKDPFKAKLIKKASARLQSTNRIDQDKENVRPTINGSNTNRKSVLFDSGSFSSFLKTSQCFEKTQPVADEMRSRDASRGNPDIRFRQCPVPQDCKKHSKYYRVDSNQMSASDIELFQAIKPLLEGVHMYKKFLGSTLRKSNFDPRLSNERPPEQCGYSMRVLKLNLDKKCIEIVSIQKGTVEKEVMLANLIKVSTCQWDQIKREGATSIQLVPFELITKDGSLDLVSVSRTDFLQCTKAINRLMSHQKDILKLAPRVQCCCI